MKVLSKLIHGMIFHELWPLNEEKVFMFMHAYVIFLKLICFFHLKMFNQYIITRTSSGLLCWCISNYLVCLNTTSFPTIHYKLIIIYKGHITKSSKQLMNWSMIIFYTRMYCQYFHFIATLMKHFGPSHLCNRINYSYSIEFWLC